MMLVKIIKSFFEVLALASKKDESINKKLLHTQEVTKPEKESVANLETNKTEFVRKNPQGQNREDRNRREQAILEWEDDQEKQKQIENAWGRANRRKQDQELLEKKLEDDKKEQILLAKEKVDRDKQEDIRLENERKKIERIRLEFEKAECDKQEKLKFEHERLERERLVRLKVERNIRNKILSKVNDKLSNSVKYKQNAVAVVLNGSSTYDERKSRIRNIIESKGVRYLTHFTPVDNLSSIINDGVMTREWLDSQAQKYEFCDQQRLDNKRNASCLSIGLPNYRYFYTLRKQRYPNRVWCVLLLDPSILWELDAAFYYTNSANCAVRYRQVDDFKTPQALQKMFDTNVYDRNLLEKSFNLPSYCTTDPQAEVLVFDRIDPSYIKHLVFENRVSFISGDTGNIPCSYEKAFGTNTFFGRRCDYSFWQNTQRAEAAYG